ncbi:MAG: hypothetical protein WKF40_03065 [Thermoleophilaceae bacterium]
MAAVKAQVSGPLAFDHADYDADGDVLYLPRRSARPRQKAGRRLARGTCCASSPGTRRIVGLTVINARWLLDRHGFVRVTVPETVAASADDLAPALPAA